MSSRALNNISQSAESLLSTVKDLGMPQITGQVESQLQTILSNYAQPMVDLDLILYGDLDQLDKQPIQNILPGWQGALEENASYSETTVLHGYQLNWNLYQWNMPVNRASGLRRSSILVAFMPEATQEQQEEWQAHLSISYPDYAGLILWTKPEIAEQLMPGNEEQRRMIECLNCPIDYEGGLEAFMNEVFSDIRLEVFSISQTALALESNQKVLNLILDQEERNMKGKKALSHIANDDSESKKRLNISRIFSGIKSELNQQQSSFTGGLERKYEQFFQQGTGQYWNKAQEILDHLEELNEVEGPKNNSLQIPDEFQRYYIEELRSIIASEMSADIQSANDLLRTASHDLSQKLEKEIEGNFTLNPKFMTTERMNLLLDGSGHADRQYEGNISRKGAYEYFMAMRKYQMLVFMMASSLGLTFIENMRLYMIPVTIVLLGIGGYNVFVSVKKEREESVGKELNKAREFLRGLARNMANDLSRSWVRGIQDHVKGEFSEMLDKAEASLRSFEEDQNKLGEESKQKSQRVNAGFDLADKKIDTARKSLSSWDRSFNRLKTDLRLSYNQAAREERARERERRRKA